MKRLVIDTAAIRHNISVIQKKAGPSVIYGVLAGDGGGAGLTELAGLLRESGVDRFAVSELNDARTLREQGFEQEEILLLHPTADAGELEQLLELDVVCTLASSEAGAALNALAGERSCRAKAQILIDTGMGFGGFLPSEQEKLLSLYQHLPYLEINGVYTHLHAAGNDINGQLDQFSIALDEIRAAGYDPGLCHAASSSALMAFGHTQLNAVRVGSALLGQCRRRRGTKLTCCCHGEASLDTVRWLPKGSTVGNERLVTLRQPTRVAVLPVGYLNGFGLRRPGCRSFSDLMKSLFRRRDRYVTVSGQRARIIGRINALETAIDVSDLKCAPGDVAVFDIDPAFARGLERVYLDGTDLEENT